jgi:hypothetical protein
MIVDYYDLDDNVSKALSLQCDNHDRAQGGKRMITMRDQEALPKIIIRANNGI